jgi:hypothetical protein
MLLSYKRGQTSVIILLKILDSSVATGAGKTGLAYNTSGLVIATKADNEASATVYTSAATHIEDISTLGTYAAPSASCCRFKEVDSTNMKGIYELQLADARFAVSGAKSLLVSISGAAGAAETDFVIPLVDKDPYTASTDQTGDSYAVVAHADYGNAKLVRSATPANTLAVDADHLVGVPTTQKVDVETIKTKGVTVDAGGTTFPASVGTSTYAGDDTAGTTELLTRIPDALITGTVNDAGASTTAFITDLASAVDDFYSGSVLVFTSGVLTGQARRISNYDQATKTITVTPALTSAPANGVTFCIIGRIEA